MYDWGVMKRLFKREELRHISKHVVLQDLDMSDDYESYEDLMEGCVWDGECTFVISDNCVN